MCVEVHVVLGYSLSFVWLLATLSWFVKSNNTFFKDVDGTSVAMTSLNLFLWSVFFSLLWGKNGRQKCKRHRALELCDWTHRYSPAPQNSSWQPVQYTHTHSHTQRERSKHILLAFQTVCSFTSLELFSDECKESSILSYYIFQSNTENHVKWVVYFQIHLKHNFS